MVVVLVPLEMHRGLCSSASCDSHEVNPTCSYMLSDKSVIKFKGERQTQHNKVNHINLIKNMLYMAANCSSNSIWNTLMESGNSRWHGSNANRRSRGIVSYSDESGTQRAALTSRAGKRSMRENSRGTGLQIEQPLITSRSSQWCESSPTWKGLIKTRAA